MESGYNDLGIKKFGFVIVSHLLYDQNLNEAQSNWESYFTVY